MIKKKVLVVSGREELMQQSPLTLKTRGELIRYASADVHREPTKCSGDLKARNTKGSRDALPKAFTCFAGSGIIILQINFFICFFFLALHCFCLLLLCFTFAFTIMIVFLFVVVDVIITIVPIITFIHFILSLSFLSSLP